ncbi:hypothetical protein RCH20_000534 [Psychrobacter sp. PL15]|uniref:AlbA family DNA-binding domain-containing protein n=1 Tax=Psychrobacter sp. PL15 TaxID=3071719 RepID=UPI002E02C47A|nr:hypothetical protein [Psychrobacter sp. PL15]
MLKNKPSQLHKVLVLTINCTTKRVSNRESEHREFKLKFENSNLPKLAKTMASFANRDGGVLFFGIKDHPRELIGVHENKIPDDVVFTNFLKEYFQPEILFESETLDLCGKNIHCLIIKSSIQKPVICRKSKLLTTQQGKPQKEILREGAIYYRYSASSDEIKYADLRIMLDKERESFFKSMVDNITLLNKVGMDKAAIVDAQEMSGSDHTASVFLTNNTARSLNWIDSGRFVENEDDAEKAYYVVRKVEIKHGVEVATPTDFAKTHPLTKTDLCKSVKIHGLNFDAIAWKLGIKDNPKHHISSNHGKNKIHKFKKESENIILSAYPLDMKRRHEEIKKVAEEYNDALRV